MRMKHGKGRRFEGASKKSNKCFPRKDIYISKCIFIYIYVEASLRNWLVYKLTG